MRSEGVGTACCMDVRRMSGPGVQAGAGRRQWEAHYCQG